MLEFDRKFRITTPSDSEDNVRVSDFFSSSFQVKSLLKLCSDVVNDHVGYKWRLFFWKVDMFKFDGKFYNISKKDYQDSDVQA